MFHSFLNLIHHSCPPLIYLVSSDSSLLSFHLSTLVGLQPERAPPRLRWTVLRQVIFLALKSFLPQELAELEVVEVLGPAAVYEWPALARSPQIIAFFYPISKPSGQYL